MQNILNNLYKIDGNTHYIKRYYTFILYCKQNNKNIDGHIHHVLPKAKDFFPEYDDRSKYPDNFILLSYRQHFIAHWLLYKAYGKSMANAFVLMSQFRKFKNSKSYALEKAKIDIGLFTRNWLEENEHPKGFLGHRHSKETKEKYSIDRLGSGNGMYGKNHNEKAKEKMSECRKNIVSVICIATGEYLKIPKEEFDKNIHKGINSGNKNPGQNVGMIVAFSLETNENVRIAKEEFDAYKGIKYVGIKSNIAKSIKEK